MLKMILKWIGVTTTILLLYWLGTNAYHGVLSSNESEITLLKQKLKEQTQANEKLKQDYESLAVTTRPAASRPIQEMN